MEIMRGLDSIRPAVLHPSKEPDPKVREELLALNKETKKVAIAGQIQDINERKNFAKKSFWLVAVWLVVMCSIVVVVGLGYLRLSDAVLITLITTTTVNVLGIFLGVTRYLFYRPK